MRRVVLVGARGAFGRLLQANLGGLGVPVITASRRAETELLLDVESVASVRAQLRPGDVVVDTAGPYQDRTDTLVRTALEVGYDVVDLNDSLAYAERIVALEERLRESEVRVLSSCSSVSVFAAWAIAGSGIAAPTRLTGCIAPSTRHSASVATAASLLRSIGRPIRCLQGGTLVTAPGWSASHEFNFPAPIGRVRGHLFETADAVWLPRTWPTLLEVATFVDPRTPGVAALLSLARRYSAVRACIESVLPLGTQVSRLLGPRSGGLAYQVDGKHGETVQRTLSASHRAHLAAVAPATLAARALVRNEVGPRGLVPPDKHVDWTALETLLESQGVTCTTGAY